MTRRTVIAIQFLVLVFAGGLGAISGLVIGALVGGNFAPAFEFAGQRGYEATGWLGAALGLILFASAGVWLSGRWLRR